MQSSVSSPSLVHKAVIIGSLGYFVDLFDTQLFAVLRTASLTDIGIPADQQAILAAIF